MLRRSIQVEVAKQLSKSQSDWQPSSFNENLDEFRYFRAVVNQLEWDVCFRQIGQIVGPTDWTD